VPISVSDINYCEDNVCSIKQTANIALQLFDNSNACLDFVSPDGISKSTNILFHIQRAHYVWEAESFYYTDSPAVDIRGHCVCPGGSSGTCGGCHGNRVAGDVQFCLSGTHSSSDCVLNWFGDSGTWCVLIGLSGNKRYKVIKLKQSYEVEILMEIVMDDRIITLNYDGSTKFYKNDSFPFEFTLISDTSKPHFSPYFIVYDKNDQSDFYLLDSTEVNDINEYSNSKFGWYKSDLKAKVSPTLNNDIQARMGNCNANRFNVYYPWIYPDAFLKERSSKLSHNVNADSFIIDEEYQPDESSYKNIPNHDITPYYYIADGWLMIGTYTAVEFIGKTRNGIFVPPVISNVVSQFLGLPITTNVGLMMINSSWTFSQSTGMTKEVDTFYATVWILTYLQTGIYGFCMAYNNRELGCVNPTLNVYQWPNFDYVKITFDGVARTEVVEYSGNTNKIQFVDEIVKGVVNVNVIFKNFTIKFDNTIIKPRINYIRVNLNEIIVNAQSATVGGSCYISSEPPDIIQAQPILLAVNPIDFKYTSFTNTYLGNFTTIIRCYKNTDRMSAAIYINGTITNVGFQNATISGGENSSGGSIDFWSYLTDFKDFFSSSEPWYYTMFKSVISFIVIIIAIILLYYITKFLLVSCLKSCWNNCKRGKNNNGIRDGNKLTFVKKKIN